MTVVSIDLPRSPDSVTAARWLVDAHATGLDPQQRQDAALMVSELVANAVLHPALTAAGVCGSSTSSPPTGEFSRAAPRSGSGLVCEAASADASSRRNVHRGFGSAAAVTITTCRATGRIARPAS
jgi:hypothetical protein